MSEICTYIYIYVYVGCCDRTYIFELAIQPYLVCHSMVATIRARVTLPPFHIVFVYTVTYNVICERTTTPVAEAEEAAAPAPEPAPSLALPSSRPPGRAAVLASSMQVATSTPKASASKGYAAPLSARSFGQSFLRQTAPSGSPRPCRSARRQS